MSRTDRVQRLLTRLHRGGWRWLCGAVWDRLAPERPSFAGMACAQLTGRTGLEIGGPSRVFKTRGVLPVYPQAARIDNVNFARDTAWETALVDGGPFHFQPGTAPGIQHLGEAGKLRGIADVSYDFLLSSHCLEHVANPLAALREWWRVTRPGGHLVLVLPDPARSFDHRRPVTTREHLRADLARGTTEDDATHFTEVLALHDLRRDAGVASADDFRVRVLRNSENRCVHHHVFDLALMREVLAETGWQVVGAEKVRPVHLVAFARKDGS